MLKAGTAARRRTLHWEQPRTPDQLTEQIATLLRLIDQQMQAHAGTWIGHVKILVSSADTSTYGSITMADDTPRWAGALTHNLAAAELTVYAAIYALTDAQVAAAVDAGLSSWVAGDREPSAMVRDLPPTPDT